MSKVDNQIIKNPYNLGGKSRIPNGMKAPVSKMPADLHKASLKKPDSDYKVDLSSQAKDLEKDLKTSSSSSSSSSVSDVKTPDVKVPEVNLENELKKEAAKEAVKDIAKVSQRELWTKDQPAIVFISGFDWLGASSVKGDYDGIPEMSKALEHARHFTWDQQDEIMDHIKDHKISQPLIVVGHSFGGDTAVEVANELNNAENKFRTIDLLVTLDSIGMDNDEIPENVRINLNYMADDSWTFLNDSANIAKDYKETFVQNFLRKDGHKELDDAPDIQKTILDAVSKLTS